MHQLASILEVYIWDLIDTQKEYQPTTTKEIDAVKNIDLLAKLIHQYDEELIYLKKEIALLKQRLMNC